MGSTGSGSAAGASGTTPKVPFIDSAIDFTGMTKWQQLDKIKDLQKAMGQTGMEAGNPDASPNNKLYVNTGKSMCINAYCNSDGKSYKSDYTDWDDLISESWVKDAIKDLDKGMKPLSESVKGYKYMNLAALSKITGLKINDKNIDKFMDKLQNEPSYQQEFTQILQNTKYTHKAYTSISYVQEHGSYDNQPVRLNVVMRKNQPAIITNNHAEHEIVGGRNADYHFTGGHVEEVYSKAAGKKIKQLVVDVYI